MFFLLGLRYDKKSWTAATAVIGAVKRAAGALIGAVEEAGSSAVHITALSQQMGLSAEATQEWGYIAEQAGSNVDELSIGMVRLAKNMRAMDQGRDTMGTRALAEMGITVEEVRKGLTSSDGFENILYHISDGFHTMGNSATRAGLSNEIFGRQAKSMVSDMARGSVALRELKEQIRGRGAVLSNEEIENSAKLGNNINNIKQEMKSFVHQGIARAAPFLNEMLVKLTEWIAKNKEVLITLIGGALQTLILLLKAVAVPIGLLVDLISFLSSGTDAANAVLFALGIVLTTLAGIILFTLVPALWAMAVPIILATLPLILFVALVALIAYGLIKLAKTGVFKKLGQGVMWVSRKLNELWGWIKGLPVRIGQAFNAAAAAIKQWFIDTFNAIVAAAKDMMSKLVSLIDEHPVVKGLLDFATGGAFTMASEMNNAMIDTRARTQTQAVTGPVGDGKTMTMGATTVYIDAKNADAQGVKKAFEDDRETRWLRHAAGALGGD